MYFEWFIGIRYLRARQKHAFISLINVLSIAGVAVGVMALIVVIAVMAGFEEDLKSRILAVESHVILTPSQGSMNEYRPALKEVEAVAGVEAATPYIKTQVMIRSASGASGSIVRGVDPESAQRVILKLDAAALGGASGDVPPIVLGRELAKHIGVWQGDTVYVISPRGMISPVGYVPSMKRFEVTGIFESGMYEYDGSLAFVRLEDAQAMLRMSDAVTGIEIRVNNIYHAKAVAQKLSEKLGSGYRLLDWMQMNRNLFSALKLEKTVMFVILTLIVLVAAFNIASALIMMVMEKTKDIAILKAMGATNRSIRIIFVLKGLAVGVLGTGLGVCLGLLLCFFLKSYPIIQLPEQVFYVTTVPVQLEALDVFWIGLAAVGICFLSTLHPAGQAAKLDPVQAIRYG